MDVIFVVAVVQHRVKVDVLDLGHGGDVAGNRVLDLQCSLPRSLNRWPTFERLLAVVDQQLGISAHRALVDAEHAELADEGIIDDLEHVGDHVIFGVGVASMDSAASPSPLTNGGALASSGFGSSFSISASNDLTPAPVRARQADRYQMAFAKALLEGVMQFLAGQAFLAVFGGSDPSLVDFHHLVDDLLVCLGHGGEVAVALRLEEAVKPGSTFCRQVDRQAFIAECLAQFVDQRGGSTPSLSILLTMIRRHSRRARA